jgi:hypothetical protein
MHASDSTPLDMRRMHFCHSNTDMQVSWAVPHGNYTSAGGSIIDFLLEGPIRPDGSPPLTGESQPKCNSHTAARGEFMSQLRRTPVNTSRLLGLFLIRAASSYSPFLAKQQLRQDKMIFFFSLSRTLTIMGEADNGPWLCATKEGLLGVWDGIWCASCSQRGSLHAVMSGRKRQLLRWRRADLQCNARPRRRL